MNLDRIDLSDSLIHFVRKIDTTSEDYFKSEMHPKEYAINGDIVENDIISPFFVLRRVIRNLQLLSTWSYRNGQKTIYGEFPVVCLTEMPISEFVKTSIDRESKGQKISNYGLIFNKKQMFSIGSRPVIYGTSQSYSVFDENNTKFLSPSIFDKKELYRYVAFNLDRLPYPIDWTHEREWRWPNFEYKYYPIDKVLLCEDNGDEVLKELYNKREVDRIDFHGLNIDQLPLTNIGIILKTEEQARLILRDILWLIDSKKINRSTFGYILFFNKLEQNLEKLTDKKYIQNEINKGLITFNSYFVVDSNQRKMIKENIDNLCSKYKDFSDFKVIHQGGLSGISYPCLSNNQDNVTRILVDLDLIKITKLGRYLIDLPVLNPTECMENNELFVLKYLNPELEKILKVKLTYYSVGDTLARRENRKIDINDVPFYTEPSDDEWNFAHNEDDF